MAVSVEQFAIEHGGLHPEVVVFLAQYFTIDLGRVKVNAKLGKTSALGTSVWVFASTIVAQRGKLNAEFKQWNVDKGDGKLWWKNNRAIDLATVAGMRTLAHECYHVQQWLTRPWWSSLRTWVGDFFRSVWHERRVWSHRQSKWEIEAIDFERSIANNITRRAGELEIFKELR